MMMMMMMMMMKTGMPRCRSYPQLRATFEEYQKLSGKDIADSISSEMSGDLKKGMLTVGK